MTSYVFFPDEIKYANIGASSLSLIGSLYVFCRLCRAPYFNAGQKMVYFIAMADFLFSIANLLSIKSFQDENFCIADGFLREFSIISSMFWTSCLAIISYKNLKMDHRFNPKKFLFKCLLLGILLATILALLPILHVEGFQYTWITNFCWVSLSPTGTSFITDHVMMYSIFEAIPMALCFLVTIFCYLVEYRKLKIIGPVESALIDYNSVRLLWYPVAFFITALPAAVDDIMKYIFDIYSPILVLLHIGVTHSLGLVNALVFRALSNKYEKDDFNDNPDLNRNRRASADLSNAVEMMMK